MVLSHFCPKWLKNNAKQQKTKTPKCLFNGIPASNEKQQSAKNGDDGNRTRVHQPFYQQLYTHSAPT